ncbi:MAG: undecaprenyl-diphosphatase UppP [Firmicutes bacterium]|nr:undecaprenyl-diphosphatase UppP [Bacillota bacterium]
MIHVIILGIIQGIAEFLPISSSAHLIIFRDIFGIGASIPENVTFAFDIALHLGTLLAIIVFFFKDFLTMFINGFTKGAKDKDGKLMWMIIVATIPAALAGVLFEDTIDKIIRSNYLVIALALIIMGVLIYLADKHFKQNKEVKEMSFKDAMIIGCSQVLALIPGFSRSGTTIAAARTCGIKREDSAKFSFFLSAPVVLGAVILTLLKDGTISIISANLSIFIIGILVSFIIGLLCISFLLKFLRKNDFKLFMWYRIILGIIVILSILF